MDPRTKIIGLAGVVALLAAGVTPAGAHGGSPALCGVSDTPETGIQGDIPPADQESGRAEQGYNCGLSLVGEYPLSGNVQGSRHCAYVRSGGSITVLDVSDPANPMQTAVVPALGSSETMRAVTTDERAVLVSGRSVYDIGDCENPVPKGEIQWPGWPTESPPLERGDLAIPGPVGDTPVPPPSAFTGATIQSFFGGSHDIRVSRDATKVYASFGAQEADITNLEDPTTWTARDHICDLLPQYYAVAPDPAVCEVLPRIEQMSHGPDSNASGTRLYLAGQLEGPYKEWLLVIDVTKDPPEVVGTLESSPGHSIDWFRTVDGSEYLLHANEIGFGDTCQPHPRPSSLGWAYEAFLTDISDETAPQTISMLKLAINEPENCEARSESGHNPWVSYHIVDDPDDASFAMVSFGSAGLRVFDIGDPEAPTEVAYFNRGPLVHAGVSHYDASRGLIYVPGGDAFRVLEIQPQVFEALGLPEPDDPAYPRYEDGRPAQPAD